VSIHVAKAVGTLRRVVISCDVAGCPVQLEPPAAESWRSDPDARSWARAQALGWVHDAAGETDYCPTHARYTAGATAPHPTSTATDAAGNPRNRDEYAAQLRKQLDETSPAGDPHMLTSTQATVAARLLEELAGVYRGEALGVLAHDMAIQLDGHIN